MTSTDETQSGVEGPVGDADQGPELDPVSAVIQGALARSVDQLRQREAGVRRGDDPEDVHKFRVATRRLRSDLRTFRPRLDQAWVDRLRSELRWLGGQIGPVRDADVLRMRLDQPIAALPQPLAPDARPILDRLEGQRALAHSALVATLSADRYARLLDTLTVAADSPSWATPGDAGSDRDAAGGEGDDPTRVAAKLVKKPWRHLVKAVDALAEVPEDHDLHEVRIRAKRARYAVEAVTPLVGSPAPELASALADVQSVLGDHQDTVVAEEWLFAAADEVPEIRDSVDVLVALQRRERRSLRAAWPVVWRSASAPDLQAWLAPSSAPSASPSASA
jgi:CHAD domain-containing protein